MSIGAMLKNYLTKKGFEKYKGSSTYYKVFREKYWAIAELYRDKNHCVYIEAKTVFIIQMDVFMIFMLIYGTKH